MPVQRCQTNGKAGRRWGKAGKCYACNGDCKAATKKALAQATAMGEFRHMEDTEIDELAGQVEEDMAKHIWEGSELSFTTDE